MMKLTKAEKREAMRSKFKEDLNDRGLHCEPEVCENCLELIDESNPFEDKLICSKMPGIHRRHLDDFVDFPIPLDCPYILEHIVVGEQDSRKKTELEILNENDDEIIEYMESKNMNIGDILDDIEKNGL